MTQNSTTLQELAAALPYRVKLLGSPYVAAFGGPAAAMSHAMRESRLDGSLMYVVESPDAEPAYWQHGNPVRDPAVVQEHEADLARVSRALVKAAQVRKLGGPAVNAGANEKAPLAARIAARDVHYQLIERFGLADDPYTNAAVRELLVGLATYAEPS